MSTSTIPYDPSLVLGMIVDPNKIKELQAIADEQKQADLARDHFNALLRQKLSLDMTLRELVSLGANFEQIVDLEVQVESLMDDVTGAAKKLATAVVSTEKKIAATKAKQGQKQIGSQMRSPLDFAASQLQHMPLSADSMDMDVQYFRYESNEQKTRATANSISSFVGAKVTNLLGPNYGAQAGASSHRTATDAYDNHGIFGTLVICANCTSKDVQMFSPMVLDPDAALESYVFSQNGSGDGIPIDNLGEMTLIATSAVKKDDQKSAMPVITGASYGSSFVGFVHFEQVEKTDSHQSAESASAQARAEVEVGLFLGSLTGSFGIDAQTSNSLKELMSTSDIQSHCSVITMGLIPSIKSNQVKSVVKSLQDDPKEQMKQLAAMQKASDSSVHSLAASGADAKKGQSIEQMKSDFISASVSAVGKLDETTNQVIDLNSMMVALDDYVAKAGEGKIGVPINYYLSYVSRRDVALQWMNKYHPNLLAGDDAGDEKG